MLHASIRGVVFVAGCLMLLGGIASLSLGHEVATAGLWTILVGVLMVSAAVVQRTRYRSESAEKDSAPPGPGGGEPGYLEPRFMPTMEVFVDPTTGRLMRVYVDPRTGDRRYRAEG